MSALRPATSQLRRVAHALGLVPGIALAILFALPTHALAQNESAPPQQPVAPLAEPTAPPPADPAPPQQGAPASAPGLVDKLGDLVKGSVDGIKGSVDSLSSGLKGTQQTIQDLNQGTADTLSRLPVTGFATGHARCTRADNGAPDCRVASDQLCQAKGYKTGRGVDIETAENCNPRAYIPGHQKTADDCRTDNYVTRAACN
jgi:hypothetical protein